MYGDVWYLWVPGMELVTYQQSSARSFQIARILFGKCVRPWYTWLCLIATEWEELCSSDVIHVTVDHFLKKFSWLTVSCWPLFAFFLSRNKHNIIKVQHSFISPLFNNASSASALIRIEEFSANQQNIFWIPQSAHLREVQKKSLWSSVFRIYVFRDHLF